MAGVTNEMIAQRTVTPWTGTEWISNNDFTADAMRTGIGSGFELLALFQKRHDGGARAGQCFFFGKSGAFAVVDAKVALKATLGENFHWSLHETDAGIVSEGVAPTSPLLNGVNNRPL